MIDFDKLFTDEMLAAYIDGEATPLEKSIIEGHLSHEDMQEMLDIVSDIQTFPESLWMNENMKTEALDSRHNDFDRTLQELQKHIEDTDERVM